MPKLDPDTQRSLWKLANALAKALRSPGGPEAQGDPQWRVSALASRAWKITHPDLPVVEDDEGMNKDVLLQFHVQPDEASGLWFAIAQNKVVGPETHASPRALIVSKEESPPSDAWDFEEIGMAAANFFKQQKKELVEKAQAMVPDEDLSMGEESPQPGAGGPTSSRRAKSGDCPKCGSVRIRTYRCPGAPYICRDCGHEFSRSTRESSRRQLLASKIIQRGPMSQR